MAKPSSIPQGGPKRLKSAGKTGNFHGDVIAIRAYWLIHTSQKPLICALSGTLLLILLILLLLPYLVAPFYRVGHPVSTLMAWRWLKGAPVTRQWIDLKAMSPSLPRAVVGAEDAKFCSHRGVDWDALREVMDDAEDGEVTRGGSTITQQVAKNLFLWPGRSVVRKALELPLSLWIDLVLRQTARARNLSQHRRTRAVRAVRRRSRLAIRLRPLGCDAVAPRGGAVGFDPAQSGQAQRPQSRPRRAAARPGPMRRGRSPRRCSAAGAKIVAFEPILAAFCRLRP